MMLSLMVMLMLRRPFPSARSTSLNIAELAAEGKHAASSTANCAGLSSAADEAVNNVSAHNLFIEQSLLEH